MSLGYYFNEKQWIKSVFTIDIMAFDWEFHAEEYISDMMLYKTSLQEILVGVKKVSGNEFLFFILSVREGRRAKPTVFRLLKIAKM